MQNLLSKPFTLRDARADDSPRIEALWRPWVMETAITFAPQPKSAAEIADMIVARRASGHAFALAFDENGRLLGFATYGQFRAGAGYRHALEHTVILAPSARGRGVGRALMTHIEADARAKGHHIMVAGVSGENPDGLAFHRRLGYVDRGLIPGAGFKFERRMDLYLLVKDLTADPV